LRIKHTTGEAASIVHAGVTFEPEEDGYFRIPFDLAQSLIATPFWEEEPATVVVPAAPELEEQAPPTTPGDASVPDPDVEELTPAQKGALTKAANAAKAAEAN
jgi:hypothetical protein